MAFAGAASADITLTGTGEMGIAGGSGNTNTTFFQSFDVRFTGAGEADNGLSFGATVDLEDVIDSAGVGSDLVDDAGRFADYSVFISGAFGTLTMGDTDGALDFVMDDVGNVGNPGSLGDNETGHAGYNGFGQIDALYNGQVLRYNYSVAGFDFAVSASVDNDNAQAQPGFGIPALVGGDNLEGDAVLGLGVRYGADFGGGSYRVALGYQTVGDVYANVAGDQSIDVLGLSARVLLDSGFSAALTYAEIDTTTTALNGEHFGIGFGYEIDAISFHFNYGEYDWDAASTAADSEGYGLAAAYDFGGGLTAHIGYGRSEVTALNGSAGGNYTPATQPALGDTSTWSLGLRMAF